MIFVNLTPHDINIVKDGVVIIKFCASGKVARCKTISSECGNIEGVPLFVTRIREVIDLPPMTKNVFYIVSTMVREKEYNRHDLLSPAELVRDEKGNVIGCKGFTI